MVVTMTYMYTNFVFCKGASPSWWNHMHYQHHAKPNVVCILFASVADRMLIIHHNDNFYTDRFIYMYVHVPIRVGYNGKT